MIVGLINHLDSVTIYNTLTIMLPWLVDECFQWNNSFLRLHLFSLNKGKWLVVTTLNFQINKMVLFPKESYFTKTNFTKA